MGYSPVVIVDTWEDWDSVQSNPPSRFRRSTREAGRWSNFDGLEVKVALLRAPNYDPNQAPLIGHSEAVYRFMAPLLADEVVESFYILILDTRHRVTGVHCVSRGSLSKVDITPADVFRVVLAAGTEAFIVVHNHPSGNAEPSHDDIELTERLSNAAKTLALSMLDHIIIGSGGYVSLADRECL